MSTKRQTPFRPRQRSEISQAFNDGVVTIYETADTAAAGYLPVPSEMSKGSLCYQERKLGIRRYYEAKQNQIHLERVIRIPKPSYAISNLDVAKTEDGQKYRIDLVQEITDVYPPCLDLSLAAWESGQASAQEV